MLGNLVYFLILAKGGSKFIDVPLDERLSASVNEIRAQRGLSLYWDANERITPVARFVMLYCLERGVSVGVLSRYIGVSQSTVRRLRRRRQRAGAVSSEADLRVLLRDIAFEGRRESGAARVP